MCYTSTMNVLKAALRFALRRPAAIFAASLLVFGITSWTYAAPSFDRWALEFKLLGRTSLVAMALSLSVFWGKVWLVYLPKRARGEI